MVDTWLRPDAFGEMNNILHLVVPLIAGLAMGIWYCHRGGDGN